MDFPHFLLLSFLFFILLITLALLAAVVAGFFYHVPYVPSRKRQIAAMITAAHIGPYDHVADLGCGDGKILFLAEKTTQGVSFTGFENAPLPLICHHVYKFLKKSKVRVYSKNFFKEDLSKFTVVLLYLLPDTMDLLLPKLEKELPKGARVVSNIFQFSKKTPTRIWTKDDIPGIKPVYVYTF